MAPHGHERYPDNTVANLKFNTLLDGLFHTSTYIFVAIGLTLLWRAARRTHVKWSGKMLTGTLLIGFGLFNLVEGIIDHHILGIHHVNETAPPAVDLLGYRISHLGRSDAVRRLVAFAGRTTKNSERFQ